MNRWPISAALALLAAALPASAQPPGGARPFDAVVRKIEASFDLRQKVEQVFAQGV